MKYTVILKNGCSIQTNKKDVENDPIIKMLLKAHNTEIVEIKVNDKED